MRVEFRKIKQRMSTRGKVEENCFSEEKTTKTKKHEKRKNLWNSLRGEL
jgi:hypothetical protein